MSPLAVSSLIFVLVLAGLLAGALLRRVLPESHLSKESQDVVRLGAGLVATMAALVLGLLIAAAKSSFDTQSAQVKQITADVILLDNILTIYGADAQPLRVAIRQSIEPFADILWREKREADNAPFHASAAGEALYLGIQALTPHDELHRSLQARAVQISNDLAQTRLLLFVEKGNLIPVPFLAVLTFWLVIIFFSFSLFATLNATVLTFMSFLALSASCAIFLILELSAPFTGLLAISSEPLRHALAPL